MKSDTLTRLKRLEDAIKAGSGVLNLVYNDCKDGNRTAMRAFDELSQVANRCSGQRYDGCKDSTAVIVEMGARWEELTANAIEEF